MKIWILESGSYFDTPDYTALFFFQGSAHRVIRQFISEPGNWIEERDGDTVWLNKTESYDYVKLYPAPLNFFASREIRALQSPRNIHAGQKDIPLIENSGVYPALNSFEKKP